MLSLERHGKPNQHNLQMDILSTLCGSQLHKLLVHELGHSEVTQKVFLCYSALSSADKLISGTSHKCKAGHVAKSHVFLTHSVQLLYYSGFLHQTLLQNMIKLIFNRDAEPTLEAYTISWGRDTTKKEWCSVKLDLLWGYSCSRIHRLNTWAKNSSKIFQNHLQNFSTRFSLHYMAEKTGNVIQSSTNFLYANHSGFTT